MSGTVCPRIALVGCGWFAHVAHVPALRRLEREGKIRVTALCSRSEASIARVRSGFGRPQLRGYTRLEELLDDPEVDLVDLVLPIADLPDAIRAALRKGKHVLSEKPCAPTVREGLRLLNERDCLEHPPRWAVAENWRFKPTTELIGQILGSAAIGTVHFADFRHMVHLPRGASQGWRGTPVYPGGHLLDSGVHFVALLRQTIGEIESVKASVSQRQPHLPPSDTVSAIFSFANGAEGTFRLSFAAHESTPVPLGLSVVGSAGTLHAGFRPGHVELEGSAGRRIVELPEDRWIEGGVYELLAEFIGSIASGAPPRSSAWEALRDVAVVEAMLTSSRTGRPVDPRTLYPCLGESTKELSTYQRSSSFTPSHLVDCGSVADVQRAVTEAAARGLRVRAVGMGSSWAAHLATRGVSLRLARINHIAEIDSRRRTMRVGAGARLGDVTRALAVQGLSLPSLSFFPDVTIGGAVATGTHGTSHRYGILADFVISLDVVLASGELRRFGPESEPRDLRAARVAVGMLGPIVALELQAVPMPWVRHAELHMTLQAFIERRAAIFTRYEHVWVHWLLATNEVRIEALEVSPGAAEGFQPYVDGELARWAPAPPGPPPLSFSLWARGLRRARRELSRARSGWRPPPLFEAPRPAPPGSPLWLSMQYGVPLPALGTAIEAILSSGFPERHPEREIELKFLKGDPGSDLGPNADGDAVLFNLWWRVEPETIATVFAPFEAVMRNLRGRPHWGKLHRPPDTDYMATAYSRWPEFESVRSTYDPGGTFSIFR